MERSSHDVSIRTLAGFHVVRNGAPLTFATKAQRKPLLLLKLLIALGADQVPQQSLADTLWPDSEGDAARSTFHTTLHRLRRLLGKTVLTLSDGRLSLNTAACNLDVADLQGLFEALTRAKDAGRLEQVRSTVERILDLYRRPFLDGDAEIPGLIAARVRLHHQVVRQLLDTAAWLGRRGDQQPAIALYSRGIELDDTNEEFYRQLMLAYQAAGNLGEALAVYDRCADTLWDKSGVEPSRETQALRDALRLRVARQRRADAEAGARSPRNTTPHRSEPETLDATPAAHDGDVAPRRDQPDAPARHGASPFTGRAAEAAALQECLRRTVAGAGQFVAITGEAGIGKTRLLQEFVRSLDREQVEPLEGRCTADGRAVSYFPWVEAMRAGQFATPQRDVSRAHDAIVAQLIQLDPDLERHVPVFLHLLSIPSASHPLPEGLTGGPLRHAIELAFAAWIEALTMRRPLVLVLEDWHWTDAASERALFQILELVPTHRLMVVLSYRPAYRINHPNSRHVTRIDLEPLAVSDAARICAFHFGSERVAGTLVRDIYERTGGNPFFIEETALELRSSGRIVSTGGHASFDGNLEASDVPDSIEAVIRNRVERLGPAQRQTLAVASVIGREFSRNLLEAVHFDPPALSDILEELRNQDLIHHLRVLPEPRYAFKHALTHLAVYRGMPAPERQLHHARIAASIEGLYRDHLDDRLEELARHHANAGNPAEAAAYFQRGGDKAARLYSLQQARSHYREALRSLALLSGDPETRERIVRLSIQWAQVSIYAPTEEYPAVLERAIELARPGGNSAELAELHYWLGRGQYILGDLRSALVAFQQAVELAGDAPESPVRGSATRGLGMAYYFAGQYPKAIQILEQGIPRDGDARSGEDVLHAMGILACIYGHVGHFRDALTLGKECLERSKALDNPTRIAAAHLYLGFALVLQGMWDQAEPHLERSIETARKIGDVFVAGCATCNLGFVRFMKGDQNAGISMLFEGIASMQGVAGLLALDLFLGFLAEALALAGRHEGIAQLAELATRASRLGIHHTPQQVQRALAIAESLRDNPDAAEVRRHMEGSVRFAVERRAKPDLGITYLRWAEILTREGDSEEAHRLLEGARRLFDELDMPWWLERSREVETALAQASRRIAPAEFGGKRRRGARPRGRAD